MIDAAFQNIDFVYDPLPQSLFVTADHAFDLGFLGDSKPELKGILDLTVLNQVLKEKGLAEIQSP